MSYRIACIDLGGTMIKSGLWDGTALSHTQQTPTHSQEGAQAVLDRVITLVRAMGPIDGVGLSTAGEVEPESGRILLCDNIPGLSLIHISEPTRLRRISPRGPATALWSAMVPE